MKLSWFILVAILFASLIDKSLQDTLSIACNRGLNQHNIYRLKHHASQLVLSTKLNSVAQKYANYLRDKNLFQHSGNGYGENLFKACSSVKYSSAAIQNITVVATVAWYNEVKNYNFNNPGFSYSTGHFTQVVWNSSKSVGFGVATDTPQKCIWVVANYDPPGNVIGRFPQNVFRA